MDKRENKIRKALPADAPAIKNLINYYAGKGWMLPRALSTIYENIRNFWVVELRGDVTGCAALQVCWEDIAEIRSLAVAESERGKGWGKALIRTCLEEASGLGIRKVFTLSFLPELFKRQGFREIDKNNLPHKIWKDCVNCQHFPDCKEVALEIEIGER